MRSDGRALRSSQAIQPYGPGAILDWGQECFVVLGTDGRNPAWRRGRKVDLPRLEKALRANEGFRLPPKIEGHKHPTPLKVMRFPAWLFCPKCRRMYLWNDRSESLEPGQVPSCKQRGCSKPRTTLVPMRWVAACPHGHLEDVNWWRWAHSGSGGGRGHCDWRKSELKFRSLGSRGASLEALEIACETCGAARNLREIVGKGALRSIKQKCRGKQPWQIPDEAEECEEDLSVLQRSQAGLHLSQVVSALDIRTTVDEEGDREGAIYRVIDLICGPGEVREMAPQIARGATNLLRQDDADAREVDLEEVLSLADELEEGTPGTHQTDEPVDDADRETELMHEEWSALTTVTAEVFGRPPLVVRRAEDLDGEAFRELRGLFSGIFLVDRLREVRVFEGFRRVQGEGRLMYPDLSRTPPRWLPAAEVFGEGIFLQFDPDRVAEWERGHRSELGDRYEKLRTALQADDPFTKRYQARSEHLERFLMVHTFAHLLIRQLCYESGYHNASLRERLYVFSDKVGVLIYTADGDSEGSLGGLVRQGEPQRLWSTVVSALERGAWCSNDPVCSELPPHGPSRSNLAGCHACAMAAETSCTESNGMLDRMAVVGDGSLRSVQGFFRPALDATLERVASRS